MIVSYEHLTCDKNYHSLNADQIYELQLIRVKEFFDLTK